MRDSCHKIVLLTIATCVVAPCNAQDYAFFIDPAQTWTDGYSRLQFFSAGTFKGTFDPNSNPLGTQTKAEPGSFGINENDPISASPYFELGHAALVRTSGTFHLHLDTGTSKVTLSDYVANRVPVDPLRLTGTVALNNAAFQTIKPTGSFPAHLAPVTLGTFTVEQFWIRQHPGGRTATAFPLGGGRYAVVVTFMAEAEVRIKEFGPTFPIKFDVPYSLVGFLQTNGTTSATFGYPRGSGGENFSLPVNIPVDPFPIVFLNGMLPPPNFMVTTTINRIGIKINGTRQMVARTG
ncbi:MAG: hypothetical protein JSS66_11815 [Armatimonadetes bacterium]|nr:hypothetical protein [Armatimonadota bacterium]